MTNLGKLKVGFVIFGILYIAASQYLILDYRNGRTENLEIAMDGVVDNVIYDVKGVPSVTVNKKQYYLSAGYNFERSVAKGDFLQKRKGSNVYILTKKDGQIMRFSN